MWKCRIAPSLGGGFAGTPMTAWKIPFYSGDYVGKTPVVFFGLYGLPDFFALWNHKGEKAILWAGSDIRHFYKGYWLDTEGKIRIKPDALAQWINKNCDNYVENEVERKVLFSLGIDSKVIPSFLGNIDDYEINFKPNKKLYTSVSGDEFELYGWDKIPALAHKHPDYEFHLYGASVREYYRLENIFHHGRVPQEQMDAEIKDMQGAIRLTRFDGFSEILAKSILMGQHPVSPFIEYPYMDTEIKEHTEPNIEGRYYYREHLNKYPWNAKIN